MQNARDVVVVRVSEQGDRDEENFHSPKALEPHDDARATCCPRSKFVIDAAAPLRDARVR